MAGLFRQDEPPRPGPSLPLMRLGAGATVRFLLLNSRLFGLWTHWVNKKSIPCLEPQAKCEGCKTGACRRWKGYVHAVNMHNRQEGFLELTPVAAQQLLEQAGRGNSLRGLQVQVQRGGGEKARLKIDVQFSRPLTSAEKLPEEKSPEITLNELWGRSGFRLRRPDEDEVDQNSIPA